MIIQEFIYTFNEYYPFEIYILKTPKRINNLFEELLITEIFIPTDINKKDIYVNLLVKGIEFKMWFYNFAEHAQYDIIDIIIDDFGPLEWENLYCDYEEETKLIKTLKEQQKLLILKYGFCNIKNNIYNSKLLLNSIDT